MAGHASTPKSSTLRLQDVRDAYRLIGDCRDLGSDPVLWFSHLCHGLRGLFGVAQVAGGEGWWRPSGPIEPASGFEASAECVDTAPYAEYMRARAHASDPCFRALSRLPGQHITRTRSSLLPDRLWYRSDAFEFRRLAGVDHAVVSVRRASADGAVTAITLLRRIGGRDFSPREGELLHFLHAELGRLVRRSLVSALEPSPEKLPPRLRQTLACLLEGDSEKQVAARLALSPTTVHEYVGELYRRFGVRSRAQLLAHALKRAADSRWRNVAPGGAEH